MSNKLQVTIGIALACSLVCIRNSRAQTGSTNLPANSTASRQALLFRNGDILLGNLESISGDKSVTWRREDVAQPMEFFGSNLLQIQFSPMKKTKLSSENGCRIELKNGDSLEGTLQELDPAKFVLETSYAGKLTFPREAVRRFEPLPPEREPIFTGPTGLDGWTMGKVNAAAVGEAGVWSYTNGAFYATRAASIARDVKLPDVARIEFDLAWRGALQVAVALYTSHLQPINLSNKDNEPDFGGFYSLQINSFVSTLMPVRKNEPLKYMGQIPVPAFSQKNHAHIEILASKPKRSIAFFVDGLLVKEWVDTENFAGSGTAMRFVHQGQGSTKLSNLRIAEWNGKMEFKSTNHPPITEDLANLLNGDKVSGTLETFRNGKLSFSTKNGKLDIPFERVSETFFPVEKDEAHSKMGTNIRAFFPGGGAVTFQVERWDKQGILAASPNFGRATFTPGIFERVEINQAPPKEKSSSEKEQ